MLLVLKSVLPPACKLRAGAVKVVVVEVGLVGAVVLKVGVVDEVGDVDEVEVGVKVGVDELGAKVLLLEVAGNDVVVSEPPPIPPLLVPALKTAGLAAAAGATGLAEIVDGVGGVAVGLTGWPEALELGLGGKCINGLLPAPL